MTYLEIEPPSNETVEPMGEEWLEPSRDEFVDHTPVMM
jgi:hypothetical protein